MNSDFILKIIETKVGSSLELEGRKRYCYLTRLNGVSKVEYQIDLLNNSNYKLTLILQLYNYTVVKYLDNRWIWFL
jgi:hypothetical protein